MLDDICWNAWLYFRKCLRTFPGIDNIPQNVWLHCQKCLATFPGKFEGISRNVWRHSPEYNIPPIGRVPRISFPVSVFLFLYFYT